MANSAGAAQLQEARVTQVVNDVKLLLEQSAPRPATISDLIRHGTAVRTGTQSRSELTFADLTITRLGANTIFSFKEGTREMNLIDGAILFQVPKGSGGATIRTVGVTAAITGTTGIAEFHPATTSHPQPFSKWLCLEGTFHLYLPNGQSVELGPGKMVTADSKSFSKVSTFDIAKLISTSLFFTGFDQPLASMNLIMLESENQIASSLLATSTTNPLDPTRIVNVTSQAIVAEETQTSPPASPTPPITPTPPVTPTPPPPTPSKFGTPSVISSPAPYLITNGTVITTDPSITTNGVTDYGKIYRGQNDGAFSLWAFGSTSAFDTALRIDDIFFADPNHLILPIAVFKFQSLSLTGDPTIDTSNGSTKLALIGVDGITTGSPGGPLTFTGLDLLVLATVNGSINLTSDVSFQDLNALTMYARGAGSDLTINSPISNIRFLGLVAEDSIHLTNPGTMSVGRLDAITGGDLVLQIGGSLLLNDRMRLNAVVLPGASVASGANLTLNVAGEYTNNSATESSRLAITNRDHIGTGGNISVNIGSDLTTMNDFSLVVQNTNGQIDNGGNITLQVDGSINLAGALDATLDNTGGLIGNGTNVTITSSGALTAEGDATFQILNSDNGGGGSPGHIGGNARIAVTTGGDFTANSIFAVVNNRNGGSIGSGANIIFNIGGALSATGDATFTISNRNDGNGGGTIDGDVNLTLNATSISASGILLTDVSANRGGHITGSAHNAIGAAGLLSAGTLDFEIENAGFDSGGGFAPGGTIDADAILSVTASDISTTSDYFNQIIANDGGGHIGGSATVNVLASSMDVATDAFFSILNGQNGEGTPAGTIGGNAMINVSAANISTGRALEAMIDNSTGGNIGGNALINFDVSGGLTMQGDANFQILNNDGGHIAGTGDIFVTTGGDLTTNSILGLVNNRNGGAITSGANINFNIGGTLTTQGDAVFGISTRNDGAGGGTVGSVATVDLNAAGVSVGGFFQTFVATSGGGSIHGDGTNRVAISGDLTAQQGVLVTIEDTIFGGTGNFTGGRIDGDAIVTLNAQNITTPSTNSGIPGTDLMAIEASIYPNASGMVGGDAILDVSASQNISAPGSVLFWIANGNYMDLGGGTIGGDARVNVRAASLSTGDLFAQILNYGGASIGGDAAINLTANNISTGGSLSAAIDNSSGLGSGFIGATIGGDATINIAAATLTANSLLAQIDNTGGSIGAST